MKKTMIKILAAGLVTSSLLVAIPTTAFAAETTVQKVEVRNRPTSPFTEVVIGYGDLSGINKFTKDNLPEKAKALYQSNEVEGQTVVEIINHANYFAEKFYAQDGKLRGKREAYKNAYVALAINHYLKGEANKWVESLSSYDTFADSIDASNMNMGRVNYSSNHIYNESMIVQYANALLEEGVLATSGINQYEYSSTSPGDRKLNSYQLEVSAKNYAFVVGANKDYVQAYNTFKQYYIYGARFNTYNDAAIKANYGALIYLRSKETNLSEADARQWIADQFNVDGSNPSKLEYTYMENALKGFEEAKARDIKTVDEANKLAKDLVNNKNLMFVNSDYNFGIL